MKVSEIEQKLAAALRAIRDVPADEDLAAAVTTLRQHLRERRGLALINTTAEVKTVFERLEAVIDDVQGAHWHAQFQHPAFSPERQAAIDEANRIAGIRDDLRWVRGRLASEQRHGGADIHLRRPEGIEEG